MSIVANQRHRTGVIFTNENVYSPPGCIVMIVAFPWKTGAFSCSSIVCINVLDVSERFGKGHVYNYKNTLRHNIRIIKWRYVQLTLNLSIYLSLLSLSNRIYTLYSIPVAVRSFKYAPLYAQLRSMMIECRFRVARTWCGANLRARSRTNRDAGLRRFDR